MNVTRGAAAVLAAAVAAAATPAQAQHRTFTSRGAFEAAAGAVATESFSMPLTQVPLTGGTYAFGGGVATFDVNHGGMTLGGGDAFVDLHPEGGDPPQFFRLDFDAPVTAFGADFTQFDEPTVVFRALLGDVAFDVRQGFFGVVAVQPFVSVELRNTGAPTFFVLDDLSYTAAPTVVPEPGTVWLALGGLAGIGAGRVVRRRAHRPRT
jgi:hypothetical protein